MAAWYYVGRDKTSIPTNFNSWTTDTFGYEHVIGQTGYGLVNQHVDVRGEHGNDIRVFAARSTVLLKNTNNALPLTGREKFTAVIGEDAGDNPWGPNGCADRGCNNGTLGNRFCTDNMLKIMLTLTLSHGMGLRHRKLPIPN